MAVDKLVDSAQLDSDLTSVANAIRTKGGTSAQLAFPAGFVSAINAISGGNDYLTATYENTTSQLPAAFNDHKIIPKYDTEIVLWVIQPNGPAAASGSSTCCAYALWLVGGAVPTQNNRAQVITGPGQTSPWSGTLSFGTRSDSWSIDVDGYLTAASGLWYIMPVGQTIKIYEIPVDPRELT